jgi:hypothetical protein
MKIRFKKNELRKLIIAIISLTPYKLREILSQSSLMETAVYFEQSSNLTNITTSICLSEHSHSITAVGQ